nr:uncharacterized protein LOC111415351 [Onthophagus taurus]
MTLLYITFTSPGTYDSQMQFSAVPIGQYKYIVLESILRIRLAVIILYLYSTINELYNASKSINSILRILCDDSTVIKSFSGARNVLQTVRDATKCYELLENAVNEFNKLYGFPIFCVYMYLMSCFLIAFNLPLTWDKTFNVGRYTLWGVVYMVFGMASVLLLTSICRKVTNEVNLTTHLSYNLLQRCSLKTTKDMELYQSVLLLLKCSTWRYPEFTAGGFFLLNNTTVQLFVTLIVSYVVVLYQFYLIFK